MAQPSSRSSPEWRQLEVIGGVVPSEVDQLNASVDRVGFVYAQERAEGGGRAEGRTQVGGGLPTPYSQLPTSYFLLPVHDAPSRFCT